MKETSGILGSLFDFSFSEFVTTRLVKLMYLLAILGNGLFAISMVIKCFSESFSQGLLALILAPLAFLLLTVLTRLWLELIVVIFRIAENTGRLVEQNKRTT